jgi:hypothetical protein
VSVSDIRCEDYPDCPQCGSYLLVLKQDLEIPDDQDQTIYVVGHDSGLSGNDECETDLPLSSETEPPADKTLVLSESELNARAENANKAGAERTVVIDNPMNSGRKNILLPDFMKSISENMRLLKRLPGEGWELFIK